MALYSKTPKALLLDEMNRANAAPYDLTENNCKLGVPTVITPTKEGFNTEIVVSGIQFRGYIGSVTFRYKRLDLALMFKNQTVTFDAPAIGSVFRGLANLNARYGLNFTQDDLVDQGFYDGLNFTVNAKATSLQYIGQFPARYRNAGYRLNDVIYERTLNCYNHPVDFNGLDAGKVSGSMLTFNKDYTDQAYVIAALVDGPLANGPNFTSGNSAAVMATLTNMGLPAFDWSQATVYTVNKGVIAKLNPAYDKVTVIDGIKDNNIVGPIYLQYNLL